MLSHVFTGNVPDRQENAMAFVIARAILMRLSEVAERDWAICCGNDLRKKDLRGRSGKHVSSADTALRPDETRTFQHEKNLFEVGLGEPSALGDVLHRCRAWFVCMQSQ